MNDMCRIHCNRDFGDEQPEGALSDTITVAIVNVSAYDCRSDHYDHTFVYVHGDAGDGAPVPATTA